MEVLLENFKRTTAMLLLLFVSAFFARRKRVQIRNSHDLTHIDSLFYVIEIKFNNDL